MKLNMKVYCIRFANEDLFFVYLIRILNSFTVDFLTENVKMKVDKLMVRIKIV